MAPKPRPSRDKKERRSKEFDIASYLDAKIQVFNIELLDLNQ